MGKHEPPKPRPRVQKFRTYAVVDAHAARHVLYIGADLFAQIGDFIDESDFGGEKGVRGVFDQLSGTAAYVNYWRCVQVKWAVDFGHHTAGPRVISTDDNAVGMLEILYSGAFAKELRVRDDLQTGVRPPLEQDALNFVAGPDWHGRFG